MGSDGAPGELSQSEEKERKREATRWKGGVEAKAAETDRPREVEVEGLTRSAKRLYCRERWIPRCRRYRR